MSFLGRAKKDDLKTLATELGLEVTANMKVIDIKNLITAWKDYDEEFIKNQLEVVEQARKEEMEERKRKEEIEMEERKRKEEIEMEERKRKDEMEFELQKLKLESENRANNNSSTQNGTGESFRPKVELHHLMQKYDPKENDISLYLVLFERQASRAQIKKELWAWQLLGLLPYDIAQLLAREDEEIANDYEKVKAILLKRFKLTPEKFRKMFSQHSKNTESSWTDFTYELKNYFHEWINGLEVKTFDDLSNLMITDQIKRKVPQEVREHFIDEWPQFKSPYELAEKLDDYDSVR